MKKKYIFIVNNEEYYVTAKTYKEAYNYILKRVIQRFGKANITDSKCLGKVPMKTKKKSYSAYGRFN